VRVGAVAPFRRLLLYNGGVAIFIRRVQIYITHHQFEAPDAVTSFVFSVNGIVEEENDYFYTNCKHKAGQAGSRV
jgi:hypothetical protein